MNILWYDCWCNKIIKKVKAFSNYFLNFLYTLSEIEFIKRRSYQRIFANLNATRKVSLRKLSNITSIKITSNISSYSRLWSSSVNQKELNVQCRYWLSSQCSIHERWQFSNCNTYVVWQFNYRNNPVVSSLVGLLKNCNSCKSNFIKMQSTGSDTIRQIRCV